MVKRFALGPAAPRVHAGGMVFDLRRALLKKEEIETARLLDFAFRLRARATRLLAAELGLDPDRLVARIAEADEAGLLDAVAAEMELSREQLGQSYTRCEAVAHAQLVSERGDPTPHRLG